MTAPSDPAAKRPRAPRAEPPIDADPLEIESIDLDANGVAHRDGKVVFVRGALTGESVRVRTVRRKPRFEVAETAEVLRANPSRTEPRCPHFGTCGGCAMQHLDARAQLAVKQRALEDQLWHIGRVRPGAVLRPVAGPTWGYRFRARLSVRHVPKKGGVLVGFHERGSSYVADMRECHVLPKRISDLLLPLRELVAGLSIRDRLPQLELAIGEDARGDEVVAFVARVIDPPSEADQQAMRAFARRHRLEWWLQPKGPDSIWLFDDGLGDAADTSAPAVPPVSRLGYRLPEFGVAMPYRPTDFTQVNHAINTVLVGRAIRLLDPQPTDRVVDLFCGLGNFTLPLATRAGEVVGIEGSATLIARARENAVANGLADRTDFAVENLFEFTAERWAALNTAPDGSPRRVDRMLVDPPREGALAVAKVLSMPGAARPDRIVYVSCNPSTLARDVAVMVHEGGWKLLAAGAVNMFPHTAHVESMAVLEPGPQPERNTADGEAEAVASPGDSTGVEAGVEAEVGRRIGDGA